MATQKHAYSVWAVPPDDVAQRFKKLMDGLRSEFGGPQFQPHITVVGAINLTEQDALGKFQSACDGVKAYTATVDRVVTGVYLLIHPTEEVVRASAHCCEHFGYKRETPYMPHVSILYGDLTENEKKKAQEKANILDEGINGLTFQINRFQLWKPDPRDTTEIMGENCRMPPHPQYQLDKPSSAIKSTISSSHIAVWLSCILYALHFDVMAFISGKHWCQF